MPIPVTCGHCGRQLKARDEFAGTRAECPTCGKQLYIPVQAESVAESPRHEPMEVVDFLDPPQAAPPAPPAEPPVPLGRRMLEAALDPRSIQWLLLFGGGLAVLGLIVWLVSKGLFKNVVMLSATLGAGSLAILAVGWFVALKTKYKTAGQALTFLGCVVLPLNLWFWHAQGLVTLDNHLWVGGVVCCLIYAATVYVLRDPAFIYAVQGGATLTLLLLLADLGVVTDTTWLALFFMALAGISIHAERVFPEEAGEFSRKRYGLPVFWAGQAQLATSALLLLGTQVVRWLSNTSLNLFAVSWEGNLLSENALLAGGLWVAATYLYLYSDIVVRKLGVYLPLAAFSLMMAEITLIGLRFETEGLIAVLAVTAVVMNVVLVRSSDGPARLRRIADPMGLLLSTLPLLLGFGLHLRATSEVLADWNWNYETSWGFVAAMLTAAVSARISAWITRDAQPKTSTAYFFLSGIAMVIAAAGLLRTFDIVAWSRQAPLLMLLPIAYMIAARLWRGHAPERPLGNVAHTVAAVILLHAVFSGVAGFKTFLLPVEQNVDNLYLGVTFAEATLFYILAALFRRRSANVFLAAAAACGAVWQFLGYVGVDSHVYTILYAGIGFSLLAAGRSLGLELVNVYDPNGTPAKKVRGRGLAFFESGNGILCIAFLSALLQGLSRIARHDTSWGGLLILCGMVGVALLSSLVVPVGGWRRFHLASGIGLAAVAALTINALIHLSGWQKLEIFLTACGILLIVVSYVALFRENREKPDESLSAGLWLSSLLAAMPVTIAFLYHRFAGAGPHLADELAVLTISILMVVTGVLWQVKSTTLVGGSSLLFYLIILIAHLAWNPQVAIGVYLAIGGGVIFLIGVLLSVYREKLLALPEQIAKREGVFRIINWR